ncbi:uncharacterized protein LOC108719565 isoform X2 [Xenopus laevis]|uniref:Uncharacterized protein LOC108719565 isoform X2 n=1 Tax=Xenopus laevis TaxID=8355 RepID=A0A8J1L023_XENLA|nr:uncharacterized protein LOC108719565 isoform X2 [Xenopus laevis]
MEPFLSQTRPSLRVKSESEEWDPGNHVTSVKSEMDFMPSNGFPGNEAEKLQIKLEKEELEPTEISAVLLTDRGFPDTEAQIKMENEDPQYTDGDLMVTESEITQVVIKEEELDPSYYQNPIDTSAFSLHDDGNISVGAASDIDGRPSSDSDDKLMDLLERLRKRPAVAAASDCFPFNPVRQTMSGTESPASQFSDDDEEEMEEGEDEEEEEDEEENTDSSIDGDAEEASERSENVDWCKCGNCVPIDTQTENLCCASVEKIRDLIPCGTRCITAHSTFLRQVVDYDRIDTGFKIINHKMKRLPKHRAYMRCLRKTAFRSFLVWMYGYLGTEENKPIPACAIRRIRKTFPDPNRKYTGFPGAQDYLAEKMALD